MIDWNYWRGQMHLDPGIINLNTGSFGPSPKPVFERVTELRLMLAAEPTHFFLRQAPDLLWEARRRLAEFLHVSPIRLVFANNVSSAINLVANGLPLHSPGEILLSDHEYGAMHWCWERAARRQGLTLRTFPLPNHATDPEQIVEAARAAMTSRTRLLFVSHVLSPTGMVLPVQQLCQLARQRGIISVVDGAHAPVMVPLNVSEIAADFYTGNCHKWLLAPTGSGFLVIGPNMEDRLEPGQVSGGYHHANRYADERDEWGSTPRLRFLEFEGTRDITPWLAVPAAIDFQAKIGFDAIRDRMRELANYVRRQMADRLGFPVVTPDHPAMRGSLTAFELPIGRTALQWRELIWNKRIEAPVIERPERLLVRFSTHFYDIESEIDKLVELLAMPEASPGLSSQ